jgi:hypothetical protein
LPARPADGRKEGQRKPYRVLSRAGSLDPLVLRGPAWLAAPAGLSPQASSHVMIVVVIVVMVVVMLVMVMVVMVVVVLLGEC